MWKKISKIKLNNSLLVGAILCGLLIGFGIHSAKMPRQESTLQELKIVNRKLINTNQRLQALLQDCSCSNSESFCVRKEDSCKAVGTYENPCPNQLEIEIQKTNLQRYTNQLVLLTALAEREGNDDFSNAIFEESKKLLSIARSSKKEINNCANSASCDAFCLPGIGDEICLEAGITREQVPLQLNFGVELEMMDVEIGPIKISEIGLELPESIDSPDLPSFSNIEIEIPDIIIDGFEVEAEALVHARNTGGIIERDGTDLGVNSIEVRSVDIPSPDLPSFSLTCDNNTSSNNVSECSSSEGDKIKIEDTGISEFNEVSEKCRNLFSKVEDVEDNETYEAGEEYEGSNLFYTEIDNIGTYEGEQYGVGVTAELTGKPYIEDEISISLIEEGEGVICSGKTTIATTSSSSPSITTINTTSPDEIRSSILADTINNIYVQMDCPSFVTTKIDGNKFIGESKKAREGVIELEREIDISANALRGGGTSTLSISSEVIRMIPPGCFNADKLFDTIDNRCKDLISGSPEACTLDESQYDFSSKTEIESEGTSCGGEIISNSPSQPWCNDSIPSVPKIELPDFPGYEIILPDFKLLPLINIQLPDFIIEELKTPDIELCNLNDCQDIAPDIEFNPQLPNISAPIISIPQFNTPTTQIKVNLPEAEGGGTAYINVSLPSVQAASFKGPSINFSDFKAPGLDNLFSLAEPKIELPTINVQGPKLNYYFEGVNLDISAGLIIGTLLSALGVEIPDVNFSACLDIGSIFPIPIEFIYEDYIFSWPALPQIPEIDFCNDINKFCAESTQRLEAMKKKIKDVEKQIEKTGELALNENFNQISNILKEEIEYKIQEKINQIENSLSQEIVITEEQYKEYKKGGKIKIPGQRIKIPNLTIEGFSLEEKINQSPDASYPDKIEIPWDQLGSDFDALDLTTDPIEYEIPDIPLSGLSWKKDISINIPGLQELGLEADITTGKSQECIGQNPTGNPCNTNKINQNLEELNQIKETLNSL